MSKQIVSLIKKQINTKECCKVGTYEHSVPMSISGRVQGIDYCISNIVASLNAGNIKTIASCCGHGRLSPSVILENDVWIVLMTEKEAKEYYDKQNKEQAT